MPGPSRAYVTEAVNWFNQVDATYRSEFKDLFEVHFSRFNTELREGLALLDAKLERGLAVLDAKIEQRSAELRAEFDVKIERLSANLERRLGEQTRWLFAAWAVVLASVIGLWFRR